MWIPRHDTRVFSVSPRPLRQAAPRRLRKVCCRRVAGGSCPSTLSVRIGVVFNSAALIRGKRSAGWRHQMRACSPSSWPSRAGHSGNQDGCLNTDHRLRGSQAIVSRRALMCRNHLCPATRLQTHAPCRRYRRFGAAAGLSAKNYRTLGSLGSALKLGGAEPGDGRGDGPEKQRAVEISISRS